MKYHEKKTVSSTQKYFSLFRFFNTFLYFLPKNSKMEDTVHQYRKKRITVKNRKKMQWKNEEKYGIMPTESSPQRELCQPAGGRERRTAPSVCCEVNLSFIISNERKSFMSSKISIVGAGSVGSTIAYTLAVSGITSEIVMVDINQEKSLGEALDIRQGTPFCAPVSIYAGSYQDAKDSDIVVLTSGVARKPGQTRLDLTQTNVNITKSIIPELVKYAPNAIYVIVSNPVDILTYQFCKTSGLPEEHIIGSGTILDTARLRSRLAEYYNISQQNVHAYVFGEHGDSSFVPWSLCNISNVPIDQYKACLTDSGTMIPEINYEDVESYMRKSGGKIIARKGATFYAVAISVCHICKSILSGTDTTMTVSSMMHGEYGIDDVCTSMLTIVGRTGIKGKIVAPLSEHEQELMRKSADCLKDVIKQVTF